MRVESFDKDARCAIELWDIVRDCFDDEEAVDARPHDEWLLQQKSTGRLTEDEIQELKRLLDELGRSHEAEKK